MIITMILAIGNVQEIWSKFSSWNIYDCWGRWLSSSFLFLWPGVMRSQMMLF